MHSGQGQKGGMNRDGRTLWTGSCGQRMTEPKRKAWAQRKGRDCLDFAVREVSECPPADTPDDQSINKLAATVDSGATTEARSRM